MICFGEFVKPKINFESYVFETLKYSFIECKDSKKNERVIAKKS